MNEQEALELGKKLYSNITNNENNIIKTNDYIEFVGIAINALEEIQQYRAIGVVSTDELEQDLLLYKADRELVRLYSEIGTVEECRAAVEKQIPKRPDIEGDGYADGHLVYDTWICPNCNKHYEIDYDNYEYCHNCGQHIDRSQLN